MYYIRKKLFCAFLVCIMLCACVHPAFANAPSQRFNFIPIAYDGIILDAQPCSDGAFAAKNGDFKSGFIATDGSVQIDFDYADAGSFSAGLAPASADGNKYGFISKDALYEIAPVFDRAVTFHDGLATVEKNARTFFIDHTGQEILFADAETYEPVGTFSDSVAWVTDTDGNYRLFSATGNFVNETKYLWASDFSEGVCWVSASEGTDFLDFEMQLIDTEGNVLIESGIYTSANVFCDGVCWAKRTADNTIVLIDKQGEVLFDAPDTEGIPTPYANGLSVGLENNLFTVRQSDGTVIFASLIYRAISYGGFSEGCMLVQNTRDGKYYIMQDLYYQPTETEATTYNFTYAPQEAQKTDFEIALRLDSPLAIVNGEKMYIDDTNPDVIAFTQNDRTLVPMRFLSDHLPGWSITWDYLSESALLESDLLSASFKAEESHLSYVRFNTEKKQYDALTKTLDQPPVISNGHMFLPVRALSELMEVNVFFDNRGLVVFSNTRDALSAEDATQLLLQFE